MTPELKKRIEDCFSSTELEDIYLPYKPKRKTRATQAIEKGLEPLAKAIFEQLASDGLDAGPDTIAWHLDQHHQTAVSRSTISRYLARAGLVTPAPKKRPKSSYVRFEATRTNRQGRKCASCSLRLPLFLPKCCPPKKRRRKRRSTATISSLASHCHSVLHIGC